MTREEAINILWRYDVDFEPHPAEKVMHAIDMAIEALRQPEIVRCKDCKHRYVDGDGVRYNVCEINHNKVQSDEWFCADGERKDGETE